MKIPAEIITATSTYRVTIHRLSYTSALVEGFDAAPSDSSVTVRVGHRGNVACTRGEVRAVDPAVLSKLGIRVGVRIVFRDPIADTDRTFLSLIEDVLDDDELLPQESRSTRRFEQGLLSVLTKTMNEINAAASSKTSFSGELTEITVPLLFSMLGVSRKTGRLEIQNQADVVIVEFVDGRIKNAFRPGPSREPTQVLYLILEWATGQFRFIAGSAPSGASLDLSVTGLLLEHARVRDESRRFSA